MSRLPDFVVGLEALAAALENRLVSGLWSSPGLDLPAAESQEE